MSSNCKTCNYTNNIAYWRGYFDGDGHISVSIKNRSVELVGNKYILAGFAKFLRKTTMIQSKLTKHKRIYRIRHNSRASVLAIAKLLYSGSGIHLNRKYEVARRIFEDKFFHLRKNSRLKQSSYLVTHNS